MNPRGFQAVGLLDPSTFCPVCLESLGPRAIVMAGGVAGRRRLGVSVAATSYAGDTYYRSAT
eukprot:3769626-Prymnesium_polylepis.1